MKHHHALLTPLFLVAGALDASAAAAPPVQGHLDPEARPSYESLLVVPGSGRHDVSEARPASTADPVQLSARMGAGDALHLGRVDHSLWIRGATYKASVDDSGFTYIPFLGSKASRNWPITFRLTAATAGAEALPLGAASAAYDGLSAVLDRGVVQARYELAKDSVEQTFVVPSDAVGARDLVFEVSVATELDVVRDGAGLVFTGPDGSVRFGEATVLDGAGRAEAISSEWNGESLVFRVPASFTAHATGSIVLDPLITTTIVDGFSLDLTRPDVAYDADENTFLVLYEENFSATDSDLYYRTLDGTTLGLLDEGYLDATSDRTYDPHLATIAATGRFVAVFTRDVFNLPEIHTRSRLAAPGSPFEVNYVVAAPTEFVLFEHPDVGGEAFEGGGTTHAAVVYEENARGTVPFASGIRARLIDRDGVPVPSIITIIAPFSSTNRTKPVISKFTGDPNLHGAWWIAYLSGPIGAPPLEVHTTRLTYNGIIGESDALVWATPFVTAMSSVEISSPYEGFLPESFHLVIDETFNGSPRTVLRTRARTGAGPFGPAIPLQQKDISADTPKQLGAFATTDDRALFTYFDRSAVTGRQEIRSSSIEMVSTPSAAGVGERRILLGDLNASAPVRTAAASKVSGGTAASGRQIFVVWQDEGTPGGDTDIFGALLDLPNPVAIGNSFCRGFPNSTGDYGFLAAFGDNSLTAPKTLIATNLPLSTVGYFLASRTAGEFFPPNSQGKLCLGGSIGRYAGNVLNSGTGGRFIFNVQPTAIAAPGGSVPAVIGQTWSFQAWHRDANPTVTSNFTSAIQITF